MKKAEEWQEQLGGWVKGGSLRRGFMNKHNIVEENDVLYHYGRHFPAVARYRDADGNVTSIAIRETGPGISNTTVKFMGEVYHTLGYYNQGFIRDPHDAEDLEACRKMDAFVGIPHEEDRYPTKEEHEAMRPYYRWLGVANRHRSTVGLTLLSYLGVDGGGGVEPYMVMAAKQLTSNEPLDWRSLKKKWPSNWALVAAYGIHNIDLHDLPLLLVTAQDNREPGWLINTITKRLNHA